MSTKTHGRVYFGKPDRLDYVGRKDDGTYALVIRGTEQLTWTAAGVMAVPAVAGFSSMFKVPTATVAAAGSTAADAAEVDTGFTLVTAANATKGVILPAAAAGLVCIIKNADAANAILKIWPGDGDAINALAADAAFSIAAKTSVMLVAYDATTWYSVPLLPS